MKISNQELTDLIYYYLKDNNKDYLHIRASIGVNGKMRISILTDIED
jgi:hypothetical protein